MFFTEWYDVNGVKCQGKIEARVASILFSLGANPTRGKAIATPHGRYSPDFDVGDFFVEVKGQNTWLKACGLVPMMENARNPKLAEVSDTSLRKMEWTNKNVKQIYVLVDNINCRKKLLEMKPPQHELVVVSGGDTEFTNFLKEVLCR